MSETRLRIRPVERGKYIVMGRAAGRGVCSFTRTIGGAEEIRAAYMVVTTRAELDAARVVEARVVGAGR